MRGYVPPEFVKEVLDRTDIVALVGEYVRLKRQGRNYVGLCPFHAERTPSFTVSPEKQFFYCFGCGVGGDALKFLMLQEKLDFLEALERLALRAGLSLPPQSRDPAWLARRRELEEGEELNRLSLEFFITSLWEEAGKPARRYLEERGVSEETARRFSLGYAPPEEEALLRYLQARGISKEAAVKWGLAVKTSAGRVVDRFRGRLVFPIIDPQGRVVGFGGRALDSALQPKYLNSPETPLFNKKNELYALAQAKDAIRAAGFAVLVEGYLDAITLHQFGFGYAVASLGTSLTQEQVRLLSRYTGKVYIAYDSDTAGEAATWRGLDILQQAGLEVLVVELPRGKDPDEFLRTSGPAAWEASLASALPLLEYKGKKLAAGGLVTARDKLRALRALLPNLACLRTLPEREEGIRLVSRITGLGWEVVRDELVRFTGEEKVTTRLKSDKSAKNKHEALESRACFAAEKGLLRALFRQPEILAEVEEAGGEELFTHPPCRAVYSALRGALAAGEDPSPTALAGRLPEEALDATAGVLVEEEESPPWEDCLRFLKTNLIRRKRKQLAGKLGLAEAKGDEEEVRRCLEELQALVNLERKGGERGNEREGEPSRAAGVPE
ncbi:DNA primase [Ammonifex thiophilus]|uniref:DNA primase n=1 Tax=Ammonifex thiophilus TaxID=444093 RepID=A0A3D8P377_9THEO|nr:DNA primase [Ammonifex thiophilus]RDV83228.1 DNA primase [Ammonifex thiophilus]